MEVMCSLLSRSAMVRATFRIRPYARADRKGDSLWSLADQYAASDRTSRAQFIDEVCELNGISEDNTLHSGEYLVVSYYSPEIR